MQVSDLPVIDSNVDLSQILPIQQKRTIAFVNHFIMKTVSYVNNFAQSCESRFMDFDYKIQKIEASLLILESQLSSISGLDELENSTGDQTSTDTSTNISKLDLPEVNPLPLPESTIEEESTEKVEEPVGVKACDDPRYKRFFKMLQFGVPDAAVRLKMKSEGLDPSILDKPNDVIPGLDQDLSKPSNVENTSESDS